MNEIQYDGCSQNSTQQEALQIKKVKQYKQYLLAAAMFIAQNSATRFEKKKRFAKMSQL